MIISMIAAMSSNRVIGKENALPWHLPNDLKFFKESTLGKPVIMGRKTFESIGRPLPGRTNIIITRNKDFKVPGVTIVNSLDLAFEVAEGLVASKGGNEIMVIGGSEIYTQALPEARRLYITQVDAEIDGDAYFPEFDRNDWFVSRNERHKACDKNPYNYAFQVLDRKK